MKAIIQTGYGGPEVITAREIPKPEPREGQVLVRVRAASLAAGDYFSMRGVPFPARVAVGFPKPKKDYVVGLDFAGVVESVGPGVTHVRAGDAVYGECRGSCAEYAVADVGRIARMPAGVTFQQAAAVPTSACTALQGLRDAGRVRPGMKVLINGASGGVGTFAVQIAKAMGAEVTGVCSPRNAERIRSIGADRVIDYTVEDFTRGAERYDVILDNAASHSLSHARRALAPDGLHIPSSGRAGMGWILRAALISLFVRGQGSPLVVKTTSEDLTALTELLESGKLIPIIDQLYPLDNTAEALAYLNEGHARGKVVVTL